MKRLVVLCALILFATEVQASSIALTGLPQTGDLTLLPPGGSAPTAPPTPTNAHAYNLGINAALLRNPRPSPNLVSFGPSSGLSGSQGKGDGFSSAASSLGGQGVGSGTGGGAGGGGGGVGGNNAGGSSGEPSSAPLMKSAFVSPDPLRTPGASPPGQPLPDGIDGSSGAGLPTAGSQSPSPLPSVPLPGSLALLSGALFVLGLISMSNRRYRRRFKDRATSK